MIYHLNDYRPLGEPWLQRFHISKYVKKYDARIEGRYLNPPKYDRLSVGQRVFVSPRGRYKGVVVGRLFGQYGFVKEIRENDDHLHYGRRVVVELILTGERVYYRECAFRLAKTLDKSENYDQ